MAQEPAVVVVGAAEVDAVVEVPVVVEGLDVAEVDPVPVPVVDDGAGVPGDELQAATARAERPTRAPVTPARLARRGRRVPGAAGGAASVARMHQNDLMDLDATRRPTAAPEGGAPRRVVLDVDTGVDDACALLLAAGHPGLDLVAVTCVGGNAPVDDVVANTLTCLDAAGRPDVPVARGADRPLLEAAVDARHVHGDDGMGDLGWPRSSRRPDPRHAVELLRDVLLDAARPGPGDEDRRVTLVPLAPMTNVALLLRTHPEAAAGLRDIVFMGGAAAVGNATASAEFNVFHDPEAAAVVLDAAAGLGVPVTMWGLDVFYGPRVSRAEAERLVAVGGRGSAELAGRLVLHQCDRFGGDDATIGDAGAVCAVLDPDGMTTERLPVRVELAGTWSRGRTIVDRRPWSGDLAHDPHGLAPAVADVALGVDGPRYAALWLKTVAAGPRPTRHTVG